MDIEVEDIALEAQTILHGRFQIREVHYIGEQGITYIGYDKIRKKDVIIKEFMPYRIANRDLDHRSVLCRGSSCKNKFEEFGKAFQKECEYTPYQWTLGDSNPGPSGYEPDALTN